MTAKKYGKTYSDYEIKNTAIKLAERDANTTCPYYGYQAELPCAVKKLKKP